jgi:regulation of enolase protein 1 (concanavalin A-like superfamily)
MYAVVGHRTEDGRKVHFRVSEVGLSFKVASDFAHAQPKDIATTFSVEHKILVGIMCPAQN